MKQRAIVLHGERERVGKAIQNMVDALEKLGYTPELESRLMQRRMELRAIEIGLAEVERMLQGKKLEISDEALHYLGQHVS